MSAALRSSALRSSALRNSARRLAGRGGWPAAALGAYAVLAVLAYWPVGPLASNSLSCRCGDPTQQLWFLSWVRFALGGGHNPLFSTWQNYPAGINVAANPSMPLLGVLGMPLTWLLGPISTFNLLLRAGFVCSASSMYFVLRRVTASRAARFVGGLAYGFSPYLIGQGAVHLNLSFVPVPPLLLAAVYDLVVNRRAPPEERRVTPRRVGARIGLLAAAQFLISPEILADMVVLVLTGVVGAGVSGLVGVSRRRIRSRAGLLVADLAHPPPRKAGERWSWVAQGAAWAGSSFFIVAGYPVWYLMFGPQHPVAPPLGLASLDLYSADVAGTVAPTTNQLLGPTHLQHVASGFGAANLPENGSYLGIPLLVCVLVIVVWLRRERIVRQCALLGVAALVLSLGPRLGVWGRPTHVKLPFAVLAHLPLLNEAVPLRFTLFVQLFAAVLLVIGIDRLGLLLGRRVPESVGAKVRQRLRAAGVPLMLAAGALVPLIPQLPYPRVPVAVPAYFSSQAAQRIQPGAVALTYPYPTGEPSDSPLLWQVVAGWRFRLIGGYALVQTPADPTRIAPSLLAPTSILALFNRAEHGAPAPRRVLARRNGKASAKPRAGAVSPGVGAVKPGTGAVKQGAPPIPPIVGALRSFLWRYHVTELLVDPHFGTDPALVVNTASAALGRPQQLGGVLAWREPRHASASSW